MTEKNNWPLRSEEDIRGVQGMTYITAPDENRKVENLTEGEFVCFTEDSDFSGDVGMIREQRTRSCLVEFISEERDGELIHESNENMRPIMLFQRVRLYER